MIRHTQQVIIRRPLAEVFDFIAVHNPENHPKWEPEVIEVRRLTQGPLGVGSRLRTLRRDFGRVSEATDEVTEFITNQRIAFRRVDGPMDFEISFTFEHVSEGTQLRADVAAQPRGAMRVMSPLFRMRMPRIGGRITARLCELLEGVPEPTTSVR